MNKRIALIGRSVLMAGIAKSTLSRSDWDILYLDTIDDQDVPDVIVVDLCDADSVNSLPFLCSKYRVPVVGINPAESTLTVFTGESHQVNSIQDLICHLSKILRPIDESGHPIDVQASGNAVAASDDVHGNTLA